MKHPASKTIGLVLALLFGTAPAHSSHQSLLSTADEVFWHEQARRIVDSAAMAPGQFKKSQLNGTPYRIHVPGGNMGYPAAWVRDSVMMLGGDFIPAAEVEDWIRMIAATIIGPEGWQVRPGVIVPAWSVPDHVNFNGKPTFYPGNYETGDKQGGSVFGKYPPLDDAFYFLTAVYDHWKMTGDTGLFKSQIKTASAEMPLSALCRKVYAAPTSDPATALIIAGDVDTENAKDWGFCDGEFKSGKLLFPSILKFAAARELAELFDAAGDGNEARWFREDAERVRRAIPPTFFRAGGTPGEGWLHSASGVGNQPDVWGSAFAVWSGALEGEEANRVARGLVRAYRDKTAVLEGCVRPILTTDTTNHGGWERSIFPPGEYQNGGYWGTATGWYIAALATVDRRAASDMAGDYIIFLKRHRRPDGLPEAWESFTPKGDKNTNPLYVATVALPYLSLKQAGLLGGR